MEAQLADIEKGIAGILKLAESGAASTTLAARLNDLEEQKAVLSRDLADAKLGVPDLDEMDIAAWLESFADSTPDQRDNILDTFVNAVHVKQNPNASSLHVTIVYNLMENGSLKSSDLSLLVHHQGLEPWTP